MRSFLILLMLFISFQTHAQINRSAKIDSLINAQQNFNGVILVAEKGRPIYYQAKGFREYADSIPLLKNDIFELASLSKQFTSMIIMMLKEKGKLSYEDLLEKYVDVPYKNITIRQLLTHTSGLPDYQDVMDKYWDKTKVATNKDAIEYLNKYAPSKSFEPGEKYEYSNTGYLLLASIAEKVSGEDFIELSRKWIFKPLNMTSTDIRTLEEKKQTKNFAVGHVFVPEKNKFIRADSFPSSNYTIWLGNRKGPGRISSTAADLLKWDQALYTNKLVKQATLREAYSPMKLNNGTFSEYGFGWQTPASAFGKMVMHTGDNPGYSTRILRYLDKQVLIVILSNNQFDHNGMLAKSIEQILMNN